MDRTLSETIQDYFRRGKNDEAFVMSLLEQTIGGTTFPSTQREDVEEHIDFWWESPKQGRIGIDVKGPHKSKRGDAAYNDNIHWVELQNTSGNKGSLYGNAKYIAFKGKNETVFVKRAKLLQHVLDKTKGINITYTNPKECYVPYQRKQWGRKDIIVKVPTSDLKELSHFIIQHAKENPNTP